MAEDRRQYGTGSIYTRKDGLVIGRLEGGYTQTGGRRRITVSGKTEAIVKRKLRDKRLELERDGIGTVDERITVKAFADQWLPREARRLSPNAYNATRVSVQKWIIPTIGHIRLRDLSADQIHRVDDAQRSAGLAGSSRLRTRSTIDSMLKAAQRAGHRIPQSALVAQKPIKDANDRDAMTVPQAVAILEQASHLPHGSRWVAALLQGMRQGECLGLTWDAVDLAAGTLTISWQLQRLPYNVRRDRSSGFRIPDGYETRRLDGQAHLVRPKSRSGWRVIPLVPWMATALADWQTRAPDSPHGLVWPALNGKPARYKDDDLEWYAMQGSADVGHPKGRYFRIHEARHTTATLLLEAGVEPVVITAILGHSSILTSRGYMHANTRHSLEALNAVAKRLELG